MADVKDLTRDINKLDAQIDKLEDALEPLLDDVGATASQLPLLDKAKLFSLTAYAIESLLFSSLRLQGIDAQKHAVYTELKRVQQYFAKIRALEQPQAQRTTTINREGAARVLKADLSDNKALSSKLAEKIAVERAKALLKSVESKKRPASSEAAAPSSREPPRDAKKPRHKLKWDKKTGASRR